MCRVVPRVAFGRGKHPAVNTAIDAPRRLVFVHGPAHLRPGDRVRSHVHLPGAAAAVSGRGGPLPVPPGRVVGAVEQRLPAQRGPAVPRRGFAPRVRHARSATRSPTWWCTTGPASGSSRVCWSTPRSGCTTRASRATSTCSRTTPTRPATPTAATRTTCVSRHGEFGRLADILIPFLVTRQLICGAGKVLQTPRGAVYCLSQRAEHIWEGVSVGDHPQSARSSTPATSRTPTPSATGGCT